MPRPVLYTFLTILSVLPLLVGACTTKPATEINDATNARDAVVMYLQEYDTENIPDVNAEWQEADITPPNIVGAVTKEFTSDEWTITVSYPVVLPENTTYRIDATNTEFGRHWAGTVDYHGNVTETSPLQPISAEESQQLAEEFVKNSPTYLFDGMEEKLTITETLTARCPYCWVFIFEFDSSHAGYGDRTGQMLAQVITHHRAVVTVQQLEVTTAVMDEIWDMISQTMTSEGEDIEIEDTNEMLSVAELLADPVYDTEVTIYGEVSLLGELLCPCFGLTSDEETVEIWHDLMVDNNEAQRPAVSVEGISNGDTITVTGELKGEGGTHYSKGDFWAFTIDIQ
ncbi:hypothetical protein ACFLUH_02205 [Chloroflexota bacterium]